MARRIAQSVLNASTLDILNVIRQNASYDYQQAVPEVTQATDIPKVGEIIYGTPAFANQFINALVNRIATVRMQSATFNNPYTRLKKGYLEFGETIEEIFVGLAKAVDYNPEKAPAREFKRTLPDVRSAFHAINWRVMYPITIQDEDLRMAFLNVDGVTSLIAKIVDQVYTGAEYDEFLLFKYLLIKAIAGGAFKPESIGDGTDLKDSAVKFRGTSNMLPFMSTAYNEAGVRNNTPKDRQVIFMDANFNAEFDVNVLASAFNMEKADFMGSLYLIDDWTNFDNERFDVIRANSDGLEEVTSAELALLADVKAVILDENWFQVYDNNNKMTEKYVASGLYWNYFYHVWKTISHSPFANAVVFVTSSATITAPASLTATIESKEVSDDATIFTLDLSASNANLAQQGYNFIQTESCTENGIAIQKYGAVIIPASVITASKDSVVLCANFGGVDYVATTAISGSSNVSATVTLSPAGSYVAVTPVGTENPTEEGWYEKSGNDYVLSDDTTVTQGVTYYRKLSVG